MGSVRLQSLAFALGCAGFAALLGAGLYRSVVLEGHAPPLRNEYGGYINALAQSEDWQRVLRELHVSAVLDLDGAGVEREIIPNMIRLARRLGDRESELAGWRLLVERRRDDANAHLLLAEAILRGDTLGEDDRSEALRHGRRALSLDADSARAHWVLGRLAQLEAREDEAFAHWREALALDAGLTERRLAELEAQEPEAVAAFRARAAAESG